MTEQDTHGCHNCFQKKSLRPARVGRESGEGENLYPVKMCDRCFGTFADAPRLTIQVESEDGWTEITGTT